MDLSASIIPRSDQWNADDLISGPRTVTVASVSKGSAEQPVDYHLVETPDRCYRPSKSMRRVLVAAWGKESDSHVGRRITLYRDPKVRFGGSEVGGIKISHLSHIEQPLKLALTETRGKRAPHIVEPLPSFPAREWRAEADALTDVAALRALWNEAPESEREYIAARAKSVAGRTAA